MKAKQLKDILSKIEDEEEVLFDRYDHFLDEYECYDFNNITYCKQGSWANIIELKRLEEDDNKIVEDDSPNDDDSEEEEEDFKTSEILDDIMDDSFAAAIGG